MNRTSFRFSTDILSRLGEELNPSPDQGILELVKNAYDADAHKCTVKLINTHEAGGTVQVIDDGDGMNIDEINDGWLVLGRSGKSKRNISRLGRIPAGSKGLGRLAALRMGSSVVLVTRPRADKPLQHKLRINWDVYENTNLVEEVELNIDSSPRKLGRMHGTKIELLNLRTHLSRMDVKRLARALILLADPFENDPEGFTSILQAPEYKDLEAMVQNRYFEDSDFHLVASVDGQGIARASVVDWKGEELYSANHDELSNERENRKYNCPPASFDLWAFIMNSTAFSYKPANLKDVRTWLKNFGGVHLYENGLRVSPYGNPGNDWLDMNLMRVRSPEERPGTNTSIGRVSVADSEGLLIQKTDRSGFIESEAFLELRTFAQNALDWMATRRLDEAEKRRAKAREETKKRASKSKAGVEKAIENAPTKSQAELKQAFSAFERSKEREATQLRREVQLYRTLSTAGITAATFAHESRGNPIKAIIQAIKAIQRRAKKALGDDFDEILNKPIQLIFSAIDSLSVLSSATLRLLEHGKRRVGRVEVHKVVNEILDTFEPFLNGRDVELDVDYCKGNPFLRGSEAAVESIVTNLLNNSLAAFERSHGKDRKILIRTAIEEDTLRIHVLDSGVGIEGISLKDIWLPGQTTQANGTGLGLVIVRDAVKDLGGNVDAIQHGDLGGAEIIVELPILGV